MISKVCIFFAVACVAVAVADRNPYRPPRPSYRPPQPSYTAPRPSYDRDDDSFEVPKYDFDWVVSEASNNFQQQESRDNDNTKGSYTVDLPDGRRQTVNYYVDGDSGFVAEVSYQGEARHPDSREYSAPARPTYQAPRPAAPRPAPRPAYQAPRPAPRPAYQAPRPAPRSSYNRPSRPSASNSLLAAYGF